MVSTFAFSVGACHHCWHASLSLSCVFHFQALVYMWHFLKLIIRRFSIGTWLFSLSLLVSGFSHWNKPKINVISSLSALRPELSLCTIWHMTCCRWLAPDVQIMALLSHEHACWRRCMVQLAVWKIEFRLHLLEGLKPEHLSQNNQLFFYAFFLL